MNWKVEYLYRKYRDTILNDQRGYEIKKKYNLDSDNYAILNNKIIEYQKNRYGDVLYYTGYEFYNREELDKISLNYNQRRYARRKRTGGYRDETKY